MSACSRRVGLALVLLVGGVACTSKPTAESAASYLYVWAGDSAGKASDFLAVIDAAPDSPTYGAVVSRVEVGEAGAHPHHTEAEMPASGHLLANGFGAGRTWLVDLTTPRVPKVLTRFDDRAGFSHPHSFLRLANGNVLAAFQYAVAPASASPAPAPSHEHAGMPGMSSATDTTAGTVTSRPAAPALARRTGGLVEMDERGTVIRRGSASDTTISDRLIYPYSVLAMPSMNRAVSTTTDMNGDDPKSAEWVQFWRLSDLTLLRSIALTPGPRGDEQFFTGEPRLLPDGRNVYIHTFMCGLYLVRGVDQPQPVATFVHGFQGKDCGVPVLTGRFWLQTVPEAHAVVAMDISDVEHPREVSRVTFDSTEHPHWAAIDRSGRRITVNSASPGSRIYVVNLDPATGALTLDTRFRDAGAQNAGVSLTGRTMRSAYAGTAKPHGAVFSR